MRYKKKSSPTTKIILGLLVLIIIVFGVLILNRTGVINLWGEKAANPTQTATVEITQGPTLIVSTPLPTVPGEPAEPLLTATVDTPIYKGPGTNYEIMARMAAGQTTLVTGISPDGLWWQIVVPDGGGTKGWVSSQDVIVENGENVPIIDDGAEPTPEVTSSPGEGAIVIAKTNVNIRSGPSILNEIVGLLEEGKQADVLGITINRKWWYIIIPETEDEKGWVFDELVTAENAENVPIVDENGNEIPGQIVIPTPAPGSPSATALVNVNIRSGPGVTYELIGLFPQGSKAQVVGTNQDRTWFAINIPSANNGRGWVSANFIVTENAEDVPIIENP